MSEIEIENLRKEYETDEKRIVAVDDFNTEIKDGEFIVLVGPSGCGKTTILRCICGLEDVTDGRIIFGGEDVTNLRARDRQVAMVFQNYALYPHMNVKDNIGFGLKLSTDLSDEEIDTKIKDITNMMGIGDLLQKKPSELSGGQQQRVALGRAIVREPDIFLMDEPLSNLDAKLRTTMRTEIQELQSRLNVTTVYVTHNQTEAMALGDRIIVLDDGELQQVGAPEELYRSPTNAFVADFIGSPSINMFDVNVVGDELRGPNDFTYRISDESLVSGHEKVRLGIRPADLDVTRGNNTADVTVVENMGHANFIYADMGGVNLTARADATVRPEINETIRFDFSEEALYIFDIDSGESLKTKSDEVTIATSQMEH